jgi:hypothetical protein
MPDAITSTTFHRHNRPLRTLLLESQVWFCARDMGRLMGWPLNERTTRKLDADQRRVMTLVDSCGEAEELMVSESGCMRCWCITITRKIVSYVSGSPTRWCRVCAMSLSRPRRAVLA